MKTHLQQITFFIGLTAFILNPHGTLKAQDLPLSLYDSSDYQEYIEKSGLPHFRDILQSEHDIGFRVSATGSSAKDYNTIKAYELTFVDSRGNPVQANVYFDRQETLTLSQQFRKTSDQIDYLLKFENKLSSMIQGLEAGQALFGEQTPLNSREIQALEAEKKAASSFIKTTLRPRLRSLSKRLFKESTGKIASLLQEIDSLSGCELSEKIETGVSPLNARLKCTTLETIASKKEAIDVLSKLVKIASELDSALKHKANKDLVNELTDYTRFRFSLRNWKQEYRLTSKTEEELRESINTLQKDFKNSSNMNVVCDVPQISEKPKTPANRISLLPCYRSMLALAPYYGLGSRDRVGAFKQKAFEEIRIVYERNGGLKGWTRDRYNNGDLVEISVFQNTDEVRSRLLAQPNEDNKEVQQRREWQSQEYQTRKAINTLLPKSVELKGCDQKHFMLKSCLDANQLLLDELEAATMIPSHPLSQFIQDFKKLLEIENTETVTLTLSKTKFSPIYDESRKILIDSERLESEQYQKRLAAYARTYLNLEKAEEILNSYQDRSIFSLGCDIQQGPKAEKHLCEIGSEVLLATIPATLEDQNEIDPSLEMDQFISALQGKIRGVRSDDGKAIKRVVISNKTDWNLSDDKLLLKLADGPLTMNSWPFRWLRSGDYNRSIIEGYFRSQIYK